MLRWVLLHRFPALAVIELHPIVLAILHLAGVLQRLREELTEVVVIRRVFKSKISNVAQIFVQLLREPFTEVFDCSRLLLLANLLVLLFIGSSLEALPR